MKPTQAFPASGGAPTRNSLASRRGGGFAASRLPARANALIRRLARPARFSRTNTLPIHGAIYIRMLASPIEDEYICLNDQLLDLTK